MAAYATSAKNLAGLGLAIIGLLLHFVGLLGAFWPLVVLALYGVGVLVTPSRQRSPSASSPGTLESADVRGALAQLDRRAGRGVPPEFTAAVHRITQSIRELLSSVAAQPAASEEVFVLSRMATDYLPATVDGYLRLPGSYGMTHKLADGRTPYELACSQLALLEGKLQDVRGAMLKGDSDELAVHGRFLEDRFGSSSLSLKAPQRK
jgi:hypothetical protein